MIEINDKIDFLLFELSNFSLDSSDIKNGGTITIDVK